MKFTLSWLKDHLETDASVEEIVETLTDLGLEVEDVEDRGARLRDFTIGKVVSAEKHPDADRLRVCQVETDEGVKQIICGAPNARAGITVVVAKPGVYVPGIDTTIGVGKIRGIESYGMMASEREMELSDEHSGIIELPSGDVGQSFVDWLAVNDPAKVDPVIEIAITPNRQDALGVHGIARDLAARGLGTLKTRNVEPVPGAFPCPVEVRIDEDTLDVAPHFAGRLIRGVKNGPSPAWLQDRLRAIGLRPISALVDITNFFTYDMNRPLHVFDAGKVHGTVRVHRARGGETLEALDDRTYTFAPGHTLISDDNGVESIAGIMGGEASGCTEETVDVFLESAWWDPVHTAYTGRDLKINSDARYRFERGVDPEYTLPGLEAATRMVLELCGGEASDVVEAGAPVKTARSYPLDTARVISLVGMEIPKTEQVRILTALGFSATGAGDVLEVWVPSWRRDVQGEPDLVEEVARVASLTRLEPKPMRRPKPGVPAPVLTAGQKRERAARRTMATLGYNECVTYSFIDEASAALFGGGDAATRLENPISSELSHMRPALLPGLLQAAARNQARGMSDLALFEVGHAFHGGEPGEQHVEAVGLLVGHSGPRDPHGARRPVDVFDVKADAEAVLSAMGAPAKAQILRGGPGWWHPGRHGMICLGPKKVLGVFGELHPRILRAMDVKGPAMAFTLFPAEIPMPKDTSASRGAATLSDFQAVDRDFAFVVDAGVEAGALVNAAQGADKSLIAGVQVFDEFVGGSLGEGKKSIALSVRLQPFDRTLTEEEIEAVAAKIVDKVSKATGGVLRG
ncbi:phenylalanine--tRNA ligase subunit beta [Roseibacterium sp. SDUM158017]|uniref:phenylalanine--tRNA ligase subunit beta n=1 Tax=Roseicyclus salinarum TaxID=3036773 RepID=UPI00241557B5|nr:phenylalanine--tRNA ligase subunit beta [Roseibacterium sp. SDUM158017]MDG4648978.1 phenylalanine--tRNA ligase subunit beta [Roseibacterium sp. SDUM158017]